MADHRLVFELGSVAFKTIAVCFALGTARAVPRRAWETRLATSKRFVAPWNAESLGKITGAIDRLKRLRD